jgi:hypothetical protein
MDDYEVQSGRIVQTVKNFCPTCAVIFDSGRAPNWVRFLIKDGSIMLTKAYPEFHVSEVADWSDEKLRQKLEVVTGGLFRKAA